MEKIVAEHSDAEGGAEKNKRHILTGYNAGKIRRPKLFRKKHERGYNWRGTWM